MFWEGYWNGNENYEKGGNNNMIDHEALEKQIHSDLEHVHIEYSDLKAIDSKIAAAKDIIKEIKTTINHAHRIHKVLLQWHLQSYEESLKRCEILREVIRELFLEKN